jgi:hypothetical protein
MDQTLTSAAAHARKERRRVRRSGLALMEVVVASGIMLLGVIGVWALVSVFSRLNAFTGSSMAATTIAEDKIEEILHAGIGPVTSGTETVDGRYERSWTVLTHAGDDTTTATVNVRWFNIDGATQETTISTIVTE